MINDLLSETRNKMKSTISVFEEDLLGIRSGRASTALVDRLEVDYYGQPTELRQLANLSTPEPMQILIRPFDKSSVKAIEKAIQQANIGVNPSVDGEVIRLNMPPLTKDRRQELVKFLHQRMEEARVAIRNIRRSSKTIRKTDRKKFKSLPTSPSRRLTSWVRSKKPKSWKYKPVPKCVWLSERFV
jgi:ribosome recycling factor